MKKNEINKVCEVCKHFGQNLNDLNEQEFKLLNSLLNYIFLTNDNKHGAITEAFCFGINVGARAQDNAFKRIEEEKELERMMK